MEDFLYAYNQPKKFGKYDLILDGKITANEFVYKVLTEDKEIENINLADKVKEIESKLQTHFTFETVTELPTEGEETVIYLVPNDEQSGDKDGYDEYMWVKEKGGFELIGSGTYAKQQADLQKEITDRTNADTTLDEKIANRVVINEPITITEGDNTTTITSDTVSTTTLSGTLDVESMKNSLTAEAVQNVVPIVCSEYTNPPVIRSGNSIILIGNGTVGNVGGIAIGTDATAWSYAVGIGKTARAGHDSTVAIGANASCGNVGSISIGNQANTNACVHAIAIGSMSRTNKHRCVAIGAHATVNDYGATVIRSTAEDGTYTQLYFSGANTPLAKKYFPTAWEQKQDVDEQGNPKVDESGNPVMVDDKDKPIAGEAMMGFVAKDKDGNIIARGANMLSALFPYYNGDNENPFTPTTMSLDGENQEPIAFHPSDLDMPIEEAPIEEEYKPLPIYPIVEPTIDEITE